MSTELAVVVVSSTLSAIVALGGLLVGLLNTKRADERADKQLKAEAERADKQRKADIDRIREEHAHARTMWLAESEQARRQDERNRLQKDAAEYIELLGELHDIAAELRDYLQERAERNDWDTRGDPPDRWKAELRGRLAMMTAALTLYGKGVGDAALHAREQVLRDVEELQRALASCRTINSVVDLWVLTHSFATAVSNRLYELNNEG